LQGIFEGILDERFLDDSRKYRGLRDRIKELKLKGFVISQEEELFIWSEFRNELSHSPPKQIIGHGAQIGKEDVIRFRDFLVTILKELESKKGNNY
jgi:hypothetical protein